MPKQRSKLTLNLPVEFLDLCKSDDCTPDEVLRGFIADLCGIQPATHEELSANGGYCTNGSDERMYAQHYYDRCGYPYRKEYAPKETSDA